MLFRSGADGLVPGRTLLHPSVCLCGRRCPLQLPVSHVDAGLVYARELFVAQTFL